LIKVRSSPVSFGLAGLCLVHVGLSRWISGQ
jgi:hypothetical protein